jgi:hypothetical protein
MPQEKGVFFNAEECKRLDALYRILTSICARHKQLKADTSYEVTVALYEDLEALSRWKDSVEAPPIITVDVSSQKGS